MAHAELSTHVLLEHRMEHLPPVEAAPILAPLESMGLEEFRRQFAVQTPVYKDGTINHKALLNTVEEMVDPRYRWLSPFFDEHHLYWAAAEYETPEMVIENGVGQQLSISSAKGIDEFELLDNGDEVIDYRNHPAFQELLDYRELEFLNDNRGGYFEVAQEFREQPSNKLWVPRQFHNFLHVMTYQSEVPLFEVMKRELRAERRRMYLFTIANRAITIREQLSRAEEVPLPTGGSLLMDKSQRKVINNPDEMEYRRQLFVRQILKHHNNGLIDLADLAPLEVVDRSSVEGALGQIAARLANDELVKTRHNNQALRVELLTRKPNHTVWLREEEDAA